MRKLPGHMGPNNVRMGSTSTYLHMRVLFKFTRTSLMRTAPQASAQIYGRSKQNSNNRKPTISVTTHNYGRSPSLCHKIDSGYAAHTLHILLSSQCVCSARRRPEYAGRPSGKTNLMRAIYEYCQVSSSSSSSSRSPVSSPRTYRDSHAHDDEYKRVDALYIVSPIRSPGLDTRKLRCFVSYIRGSIERYQHTKHSTTISGTHGVTRCMFNKSSNQHARRPDSQTITLCKLTQFTGISREHTIVRCVLCTRVPACPMYTNMSNVRLFSRPFRFVVSDSSENLVNVRMCGFAFALCVCVCV